MPQYPYAISIGSFVDFQTALINNTPPISDECFKLSSQYDMWLSTLSVLGNDISVNEYTLVNDMLETILSKQVKCDEASTLSTLLGNETQGGGFKPGGPFDGPTTLPGGGGGGFGGPMTEEDRERLKSYTCPKCCAACRAACIKTHGDMKECCSRGVECLQRQLEETELCVQRWRAEAVPPGSRSNQKPPLACSQQGLAEYIKCSNKYTEQGYNVESERDRYKALIACLGGSPPPGVPYLPSNAYPKEKNNCGACCCGFKVPKGGCCDRLGFGYAPGYDAPADTNTEQ